MKQITTTKLDRWLTAMRLPGLYTQTTGAYCDEHGFCGLGVLIHETGHLDDETRAKYRAFVTHRDRMQNLGVAIGLAGRTMMELCAMMAEQGLGGDHAEALRDWVPVWNDGYGLTLPQIADRIERCVELWKADPEGEAKKVAWEITDD